MPIQQKSLIKTVMTKAKAPPAAPGGAIKEKASLKSQPTDQLGISGSSLQMRMPAQIPQISMKNECKGIEDVEMENCEAESPKMKSIESKAIDELPALDDLLMCFNSEGLFEKQHSKLLRGFLTV